MSCQEDVSLCVGPVMGEVTHNKAVILLEVKSDLRSRMEVSCDLYKKGDSTRQYRQSLRQSPAIQLRCIQYMRYKYRSRNCPLA